jgi:hypothetical protein
MGGGGTGIRSQSFIHQGILSDPKGNLITFGSRTARGISRNPLFIKEFFLTIGLHLERLQYLIVAILYSSRNSF